MNRRSFLTRLSTSLVGAAIVAKVPLTWLPAPVRRYAALEYVHRAYHLACDCMMLAQSQGYGIGNPAAIIVQQWLYEQVENELLANKRIREEPEILHAGRDVPVPHVLFKAIPLTYDDAFLAHPQEVRVLDSDGWKRYLGARAGYGLRPSM